MGMEWEKLLNSDRLQGDSTDDQAYIRTEYYRDYDRIIFSAPFRRLARKTQVHPLSFNDHIHNRLTHSIEVSSIGRSLGLAVGRQIEEELKKKVTPIDFAAIIQAACAAHDIGNPPFGHAGEYAIRQWFSENENKLDESLTESQLADFKLFEGNAQGFRIVAQLENHYRSGGLRLTHATLGALIKYPWLSNNQLAVDHEKFNVFQSEKDIFLDVVSKLGLLKLDEDTYCRHPLAYLVEAADDICYKILDVEDALELSLINMGDVTPIFKKIAADDNIPDRGVNFSAKKRIIPFRSAAINRLILEIVDIFLYNYGDIMIGNFKGDLLSKLTGDFKSGIEEIKEITNENIFSSRRKIELEVGSYSAIETILNAFVSAVNDKLKNGNKLSFKSKRILDLMQDDLPNGECTAYEYYMAITDFVSGMTDNYATFIAKQIEGNAK